MRVHVINLRSRADRRAQFSNWNARPSLELVFVDAAIGADIDPEGALGDGLVAARTRLTPGALGCAQSHRELWRQVVARGETAIVCEDDACLRGDFTARAGELMTSLGDEWDLLYLGYNTDALVAAETPEGLKLLLQFDDAAKRAPGFFDAFSAMRARPPTALACFQAWGTLCYAITPRGAARLLEACFPISTEREVIMFGQNRPVAPYGIDGMINAALQRAPIAAFCSMPALVVSLNDQADSDVAGPML